MFITDRCQVIFDDVEDVLAIPENFQIARNLFQKFAVFISQLFLFQIYQLAQSHTQNGICLHGSEVIDVCFTAFNLELFKPGIAQGSLKHRGRAFKSHQASFRFCMAFRLADDLDDLIDVGQSQ